MSVPGALRELADFLEANPQYQEVFGMDLDKIQAFTHTGRPTDDAEDDKRKLNEFISAGLAFGAYISKDYVGNYADVVMSFDGEESVRLVLSASRDKVCEKRVVGTETVTRKRVPDRSEWPEITEEVEKVEWNCHSLRETS